MPFTPSHAVVALPFLRTQLVPAAIAVGAMTPDLPLFVRVGFLSYVATHDISGIGPTVLLALVLLLVWRCLLRPAVRELAPTAIARRLPGEWDGGLVHGLRETFPVVRGRVRVRRLAALVASLLIGVVSHIVWDLFTHEGRLGTELLPVLAEHWGPLHGFRWLQHASSVLGLAVIALWGAQWIVRAPAGRVTRIAPTWVRIAWWLSLPLALMVAWGIGLAAHGPLDATFTVAHLAYRVLPPACAIWGAATLALALGIQLARTAKRRGITPRHARDASGFAGSSDPT